MGDRTAALKDYDRSINMGLRNGLGFYSRATCRSELGDSKGAASDFKEACRLDPEYSKKKLPGPIKVGFPAMVQDVAKSIEQAVTEVRNTLLRALKH